MPGDGIVAFNTPFPIWLKQRRKALDLTRSQLASRINYSVETLHKVEGGMLKPSNALLEALIEPLAIPKAQRDDFIAYATGVSPTAQLHNLPAPVDALIGREKALVAAHKLLRNKDARLITFIGPPGVGKTRLAMQAAWDLREHFEHGAWFVPLEHVTDAGSLPVAITRTINIPIIESNVLESIKHHFREQHALLMLDNFEHVMAAATMVAQILSASPRLKIIVTSRSALYVAGEHLFSVDVLNADASMELFVKRAEAVRSDFCVNGNGQVITDICRQLDGLPLAIELAAARMRMFDPPQLLALMRSPFTVLTLRHRDKVSHRRALREMLAESERLLSPEEDAAFRRLGIFVGGCSLPAAEAVLGQGTVEPLMDTLQNLADHSLVRIDLQPDAPRINMLHTIREYALSRLQASNEHVEYARRHAEHFTDFAELCEADSPEVRLGKFNEESGNLRAALAYARETQDALMQLRLLASFGRWQGLQWQTDDIAWLLDLFAETATHAPALKRIRARALSVAGFSIMFLLDEGLDHARAMLDESARLFESLGDIDAQASSLSKLGCVLWNITDIPGCIAAAQHALQLDDGQRMHFSSAMANGLIAGALRDQGHYEQAIQLFTLSAEQFEALGDSSMATFQHNGMGDLEFNRGRLPAAQACYERAMAAWKAGGSEGEIGRRGLGRVAYVQGDLNRAHELLARAVSMQRQWSNRADLSFTLHHLSWVKHQKGEPDASTLMREAIHLQQQRKCQLGLIESLDRCAWMVSSKGEAVRAATLFGAADILRQSLGLVYPLGDKPLGDMYLAKARAGLAALSFNDAWSEGKSLSLEAAAAFAEAGLGA